MCPTSGTWPDPPAGTSSPPTSAVSCPSTRGRHLLRPRDSCAASTSIPCSAGSLPAASTRKASALCSRSSTPPRPRPIPERPLCTPSSTACYKAHPERLKDLALECPELKGKLHLPNTAPKSWQINLSGVPRPVLRPYTKKVNKQKARDLACLIEEKRQEILGNLSAVSSDETFDSMRYGMQVAPAPPLVQTPGVDATAAAGTLGRGYGSREEAGEDASKWEKKRKMSSTATPEMTQDASSTPSTRSMKVARKD
ncbi:hypothetical protein GQ55_1G295600 [Panicum hallii var. hallii]|uniref:Uncharacterized protein n=1 Tax=Panicum hallii var. hallii TaxID=1504633 RepID=A0A2T7F8T7_9POAL|nr:hypothetical protein GQ55_1G295600 [Panicum hallii var. hallii]